MDGYVQTGGPDMYKPLELDILLYGTLIPWKAGCSSNDSNVSGWWHAAIFLNVPECMGRKLVLIDCKGNHLILHASVFHAWLQKKKSTKLLPCFVLLLCLTGLVAMVKSP